MNIERFLKIRGWSQTELAKQIDTSSQNINKWVNNKGKPSYECCKKLLELGMSVEDLFDIDEYNPIPAKIEPGELWARYQQLFKDMREGKAEPIKGKWTERDEQDRMMDKYGRD